MSNLRNLTIVLIILATIWLRVSPLAPLNPLRDRIVWVPASGTTPIMIPDSMVTSDGSAVFSVNTASFPSWLTYSESSQALMIHSPIDSNGPFQIQVTVTENGETVEDDFSLTIEHRVDWPAEFRINTYTTDGQSAPESVLLEDGSVIIVWMSENQDGDESGVYGKIVNPQTQQVILNEFRINDYTTHNQENPRVAQLQDGKIVVTWTSHGNDGDGEGVFAKMFDPSIGPIENTEFQVNTFTTHLQSSPDVGALSNGNVVLIWESADQDGSGRGIFATILDSEKQVVVPEFQVNTFITSNQDTPRVSILGDGRFLAFWHSLNQDGQTSGTFARILNPDGSESVPEFQVNVHTPGPQYPEYASEVDGDRLFFVWRSFGQDSSNYDVFGRVFNSHTGGEMVPEFRLNDYTSGWQGESRIAPLMDGNVLVSWASFDLSSTFSIYGKIINPNDGSTVVSEMRLVENDSFHQFVHLITQLDDGSVFIAYESHHQDGSGSGIYGRIITLETVVLCDTESIMHRYRAVSWLTEIIPQVNATREVNSSQIVFSIPGADSCLANSVDVTVAHQLMSGYQNMPSTSSVTDILRVDLVFDDSKLRDPNICNVSDSISTVVYDCTIFLQAYFEDDFIVNWRYSLTLALENEAVTNLAIDTAQNEIPGDSLSLPLEKTLVGGFDGAERSPGQPFTVGEDAFLSISPPEDFVNDVEGTVLSVVAYDNEVDPVESFHLTSLCETQKQNGILIIKVPLIIVTAEAEIVVQIEWSLAGRRRLVEGSPSKVSNYSVTLSVTSSSESEGEGNNSETNFFIFIVVGLSALLVLTAGILGYKCIRQKREASMSSNPSPIPSTDRSDKV